MLHHISIVTSSDAVWIGEGVLGTHSLTLTFKAGTITIVLITIVSSVLFVTFLDRYEYVAITREEKETFEGVFLPGSLEMKREDALSRCYVDPIKYKYHRTRKVCTYSRKYDLFYLLLPKSGSSTGRHVMKESFQALERTTSKCNVFLFKDRRIFGSSSEHTLTTVSMRNPVTRFFASYDEALVRRLNADWRRVPENIKTFQKFKGWNYKNYSALFDTKAGVNLLTDTFEEFVAQHNGYPFDEHLTLQVPALSNAKGFVQPFDFIINTKDMKQMFNEIAAIVSAPEPKVIRGRSYPRRFNTSRLSDITYLKICKLSLIDFCCLNYELPPQCLSDKIPEGSRPRCAWKRYQNKSFITDIII